MTDDIPVGIFTVATEATGTVSFWRGRASVLLGARRRAYECRAGPRPSREPASGWKASQPPPRTAARYPARFPRAIRVLPPVVAISYATVSDSTSDFRSAGPAPAGDHCTARKIFGFQLRADCTVVAGPRHRSRRATTGRPRPRAPLVCTTERLGSGDTRRKPRPPTDVSGCIGKLAHVYTGYNGYRG